MPLPHQYSVVSKEEDDTLDDLAPPQRSSWFRREIRLSVPTVILSFVAQLLLFTVVTFSIFHSKRHDIIIPVNSKHRDYEGNYYPAAVAIKHEIRTFQINKTFLTLTGTPTPETDLAWHDLQEPSDGVIQASYESGFDINSLPVTQASKKHPDQFMYGLEVFHQLHCLDYVRKSFYPQVYFPNDTEYKVNHHREHCIEHLRQSIMCSGDFTLDYWKYDEEASLNYLKVDVPHVCRDFEAMRDWVTTNKWEAGMI